MLIDKRLAALTRGATGWIVLNTLTRLVILGTTIWFALLVGTSITTLIDRSGVVPAGSTLEPVLAELLVGVTIIVVARLALTPLAAYFSVRASHTAKSSIRRRLIRTLFQFEDPHRTPGGTSGATTLAIDAVEALDGYFGVYLSQLSYALTAPVVLFIVVASIDLPIAVLLVVLTPITVILIAQLLAVARRRAGAHFSTYQSLGAFYLESIDGLDTLNLYQQDGARAEQLASRSEGFRQKTMRLLRMQLSSIVVMDAAAYGGAAAGITTTALALSVGRIDVGQAIVIVLLVSEFFIPMRSLGGAFHLAMTGVAASSRIFALLDAPQPACELPSAEARMAVSPASGPARLATRHLTITYPGAVRAALADITVAIPGPGLTAVVGSSGSGKSTLAAALVALVQPDSGTVLLNGNELSHYDVTELRRAVRLVSQNSAVFSGTIADNLRVGEPTASRDDMMSACVRAQLSDLVGSPGDLEREIGEAGSLISGGQRQRLSVARALLRSPRAYIFDEATSNIDAESEAQLLEVVEELAQHATVVMITHRLDIAERATQVIVLDHGELVGCGNAVTLAADNPAYRSLLAAQRSAQEVDHVR